MDSGSPFRKTKFRRGRPAFTWAFLLVILIFFLSSSYLRQLKVHKGEAQPGNCREIKGSGFAGLSSWQEEASGNLQPINGGHMSGGSNVQVNKSLNPGSDSHSTTLGTRGFGLKNVFRSIFQSSKLDAEYVPSDDGFEDFSVAEGEVQGGALSSQQQATSMDPHLPDVAKLRLALNKVEPIRPLRSWSVKAKKWIVVVSNRHRPPSSVVRLITSAKQEGWMAVLVGPSGSTRLWSTEGAVSLTGQSQQQLNYRVTKHLAPSSYARKIVGYLFAIQHGAEVILDTDHYLRVSTDGKFWTSLRSAEGTKPYVYQSLRNRSVVNPYIHFGQPSIWPRGFPPHAIADNKPERHFIISAKISPIIQQFIADSECDVDATFRMTRVSKGKFMQVVFDKEARPVALPPGTLAPFNSQLTVFHREAFWALLLPGTVNRHVGDIWRAYWAQRLLWDIRGSLAFYPSFANQVRFETNPFQRFLEEKPLYSDTWRLVEFLRQWNASSAGEGFLDRVLELSRGMAEQRFWGGQDVELTAAWLADLLSVGYQFPLVVPPDPQEDSEEELVPHRVAQVDFPTAQLDTWRKSVVLINKTLSDTNPDEDVCNQILARLNLQTRASLGPPPGITPTPEEPAPSSETALANRQLLEGALRNASLPVTALVDFDKWRAYFHNVVLIVNYNGLYLQSARVWRVLFGRLFRDVVLIAPKSAPHLGVEKVDTFPKEEYWVFAYQALPGIFARYPEAEGFLFTHEDVVLNYWTLARLDKTKLWHSKKETWLLGKIGELRKLELNKYGHGFTRLHKVQRAVGAVMRAMPRKFQARYNRTWAPGEFVKTTSDVYYVPQRFALDVSKLVPLFVRTRVLSEVAIPMIFSCFDLNNDMEGLEIVYLWGEDRDEFLSRYRTDLNAVHPLKPFNCTSMTKFLDVMSPGDPLLSSKLVVPCKLPKRTT